MARKLSARETVLFVLLGVAGVAYLWYATKPGGAPSAAAARAEEGGRKPAGLDKPPVVRMDLLAHDAPEQEAGIRDLFKYSPRPPSAAEVARLRAEAAARAAAAKRAAEQAAILAEQQRKADEERAKEAVLHPQPPPPPQPPPINVRYLGYLGPKDDKIAVFEDGKDMALARKGEIVASQFRVVDIKSQTVVMGFVRPEFKGQTREIPQVSK